MLVESLFVSSYCKNNCFLKEIAGRRAKSLHTKSIMSEKIGKVDIMDFISPSITGMDGYVEPSPKYPFSSVENVG